LAQLTNSIDKAGPAVKVEAEPKLQALRTKADLLAKELENVKKSTESTWDSVKSTTSKAYDDLIAGFHEAQAWVSNKISG
jgi:hypothetical protein